MVTAGPVMCHSTGLYEIKVAQGQIALYRHRMKIALVVSATLLVCIQATELHAEILFDFDDGTLQGWTAEPFFGGTLSNPGSGGNPGG